MLNKCIKCGQEPEWKPYISPFIRWFVECKCGNKTETWTHQENAIAEWNRINPTTEIGTYTHEQIKTLLESDSVPCKPIVDYHAEYLKLEKDYFEDVADLKADLKKEQDKATFWFELHNEVEEKMDYWYKEWKKVAEENEKLNMLVAKIKEIAEG